LRLERSVALHEQFVRIALDGGGLPEIAAALNRLTDRDVLILDPQGRPLASAGEGENFAAAIQRVVGNDQIPLEPASATPVTLSDPSGTVLAQPMRVGAEAYGTIALLAGHAPPSETDRVALVHAATVAVLRQVQSRAVAN